MLVVGTGGLASDILSSLQYDPFFKDVCFFDDSQTPVRNYISDNYRVIRDEQELYEYFKTIDRRFIAGIGDNKARESTSEKLKKLGGENPSYISSRAMVGHYANVSETGAIIMHHAVIGNGCEIGEGSLVYVNASLGHDSIIGRYTLVSGQVCMSNVKVGNYVFVGIGAFLKPGISIGDHAMIGIGSTVISDVEPGSIMAGNPAKQIIKSKTDANQ